MWLPFSFPYYHPAGNSKISAVVALWVPNEIVPLGAVGSPPTHALILVRRYESEPFSHWNLEMVVEEISSDILKAWCKSVIGNE
jgi:hypothetical protein